MWKYIGNLLMKLRVVSIPLILLVTAQSINAFSMAEQAASPQYQERPILESSLFTNDKAILDEESIQRILASRFAMPKEIKIALFKMQEDQQKAIQYYGYGYWRSEEYLTIQQGFIDTISGEIEKSSKVIEVACLPSIMIPKDPSLPSIREAAVRMQADMILVLKISADVYEKYRIFKTDQAKAFCTSEAFFLDVRTGLIPFSSIITNEYIATQEKNDANFNETMVRAQREAALLSLRALGEKTLEFINSIPSEPTSEIMDTEKPEEVMMIENQ